MLVASRKPNTTQEQAHHGQNRLLGSGEPGWVHRRALQALVTGVRRHKSSPSYAALSLETIDLSASGSPKSQFSL